MGLNQEFLELELFTYGLNTFSVEEFADAGLNATDIELIAFMAEQEVGHAIMVANILGGKTMRQLRHTTPYCFVQFRISPSHAHSNFQSAT